MLHPFRLPKMTKTFKIVSKESKESKELKTLKKRCNRGFCGWVALPRPYFPYQTLPSLLLTFLTSVLVGLCKSTQLTVFYNPRFWAVFGRLKIFT